MRVLLFLLLSGCVARGIDVVDCCEKLSGRDSQADGNRGQQDLWICRDSLCPELEAGEECTTLANTEPTYCQVPLTGNCVTVYLERAVDTKPFQTVYCF